MKRLCERDRIIRHMSEGAVVCPYYQILALQPAIKAHIVQALSELDMKARQEIEAKRAATFAEVDKKQTRLSAVKIGPLRVVRACWRKCS
jgi:hypothetical protein